MLLLRPSSFPPAAPNAPTRRRARASPPRARKSSSSSSNGSSNGSSAADAAAAADADADDPTDAAPLLELSPRRSAVVFSSPSLRRAAGLARRRIDALFADPRTLDTRRLLDPFYVQDSFNLLRTQPGALLGAETAACIADALVGFAEEHLGLSAITPPWISFYLDGMGQETHVDAFQGPLAFVLPLSFWGDEDEEEDQEEDEEDEDGSAGGRRPPPPPLERRPRRFVGGETAIFRHGVLRYWDGAVEEAKEEEEEPAPAPARPTSTSSSSRRVVDLSGGFFQTGRGQELDQLFARVPPRFGRLLVFDGRLPHGVRPVRCPTADPRDARIALHAWFAPPERPFFRGALADGGSSTAAQRKKAAAALDAAVRPLMRELADECPPASGLLAARVAISGETGEVEGEIEWLADTLVVSPGVCADGGIGEREARALIQHVVRERLRGMRFPATAKGCGGGGSTATVPLLFD